MDPQLHTQEVAGSSPAAPTIKSIAYGPRNWTSVIIEQGVEAASALSFACVRRVEPGTFNVMVGKFFGTDPLTG